MAENYSPEIVSVIKAFLDEDDWNYSFDDEKGIFRFGLNIKGKLKNIDYIISVRKNDFVLYCFPKISADSEDADCMARMAEFITRANYGLQCGNFEMDYNDGEIRFHSFEDCEDLTLPKTVVQNQIYTAAFTMEKYGTGIAEILFTDTDPKTAIEKCEE